MNEDDIVAERVNTIFAEAKRLAIAARVSLALFFAVITFAGIIADRYPGEVGFSLVLMVTQYALGYFATVKMITEGGLSAELRGGFGAYFGLSFITTFAILLGAIVFIIPGIVLFVRWAPVYGFGLVDGEGVGRAMGKSWEKTGPHFWPMLVALALPILVSVGFIAMLYFASDEFGNIGLLPSIIANVGVTSATVGIMVVCMAIYSLLRSDNGSFTDVFS